jgi:hypothetical protein
MNPSTPGPAPGPRQSFPRWILAGSVVAAVVAAGVLGLCCVGGGFIANRWGTDPAPALPPQDVLAAKAPIKGPGGTRKGHVTGGQAGLAIGETRRRPAV